MKKYSKADHIVLANWAIACAERVLPLFENYSPNDHRPRVALDVCKEWIRTGVFKMRQIRGASLDSHAAARMVIENKSACFAARAAGQAVATAHVPQHAWGAAYYALKAIAESDPVNALENVTLERTIESEFLPEHMRDYIMERVVLEKRGIKIFITIRKDSDF